MSPVRFSEPLAALPPPHEPDAVHMLGLFDADQARVNPAPRVKEISLLALLARSVTLGGLVTVMAGP